jgi:16S rRNA processing protein RimM
MERTQYFSIGFLKRPYANAGHIACVINEHIEDIIYDLKHVFIYLDGAYIPFFLESVTEKGDIILKFDDVENPESAVKLSNKPLYITENQFGKFDRNELSTKGDLVGYKVYDNGLFLNEIIATEVFPSQVMIRLEINGVEKLLPLVNEFIINIDNKTKEVFLNLPEGILEL